MSASEMKRSGIELGHCGVVGVASANARRSEMEISSVRNRQRTQERSRGPAEEKKAILVYLVDGSKTPSEKQSGTAAIRSKILMIFLLSAARIGSCKANSAPPFFSGRV